MLTRRVLLLRPRLAVAATAATATAATATAIAATAIAAAAAAVVVAVVAVGFDLGDLGRVDLLRAPPPRPKFAGPAPPRPACLLLG